MRLLAGSDDSIVPPSGDTESMYNNAESPKQMPIIRGGSHCGFLDSDITFCDSVVACGLSDQIFNQRRNPRRATGRRAIISLSKRHTQPRSES